MRIALWAAILLATSASAIADAINVTSPDHPQTFAYGEMIWRQLYLERPGNGLTARLTFSNLPYADSDQPRRDEPFDFRFPGIQFNPAQHAFFARGHRGELIKVAWVRMGGIYPWIDLAPGAKIYLLKESGRVTAILTATDYPRRGIRWIELDDNFSLQNLLIGLLRELRSDS